MPSMSSLVPKGMSAQIEWICDGVQSVRVIISRLEAVILKVLIAYLVFMFTMSFKMAFLSWLCLNILGFYNSIKLIHFLFQVISFCCEEGTIPSIFLIVCYILQVTGLVDFLELAKWLLGKEALGGHLDVTGDETFDCLDIEHLLGRALTKCFPCMGKEHCRPFKKFWSLIRSTCCGKCCPPKKDEDVEAKVQSKKAAAKKQLEHPLLQE